MTQQLQDLDTLQSIEMPTVIAATNLIKKVLEQDLNSFVGNSEENLPELNPNAVTPEVMQYLSCVARKLIRIKKVVTQKIGMKPVDPEKLDATINRITQNFEKLGPLTKTGKDHYESIVQETEPFAAAAETLFKIDKPLQSLISLMYTKIRRRCTICKTIERVRAQGTIVELAHPVTPRPEFTILELTDRYTKHGIDLPTLCSTCSPRIRQEGASVHKYGKELAEIDDLDRAAVSQEVERLKNADYRKSFTKNHRR